SVIYRRQSTLNSLFRSPSWRPRPGLIQVSPRLRRGRAPRRQRHLTDSRTGSSGVQASFAARSIGAYVSAPLIRDGALAAGFVSPCRARTPPRGSGRSPLARSSFPPGLSPSSSGGMGADSGKPLRVLVVDDERPLLELLALEPSDLGFAVNAAENAAVALACGAMYDVILSDLAMPKMSGVAFLNEALRRIPGVPAIILTGNTGAANAKGLEKFVGGRVSLVRKPVSGAALAAAIADLIQP